MVLNLWQAPKETTSPASCYLNARTRIKTMKLIKWALPFEEEKPALAKCDGY